jgi:hypothetical protein
VFLTQTHIRTFKNGANFTKKYRIFKKNGGIGAKVGALRLKKSRAAVFFQAV